MGTVRELPIQCKSDSTAFMQEVSSMIEATELEWRRCTHERPRGLHHDTRRQSLLRVVHHSLCVLLELEER